MTVPNAGRVELALAGGIGGVLVWGVIRAAERDWIGHYPAFILVGAIATLTGAFLALAGPIGLGRALPRALALAVAVGGLVALTTLRYAAPENFLSAPMPALAAFAVATMPVPFLIAGATAGWRDYPTLFQEAWSFALRFAAAGGFAGLVWLVIYLSDEVLRIVGITVIGTLLEFDVVPLALTGAMIGLGIAVIHDLADYLPPDVVLRLLWLFLPVVLAVTAVFLVALPFRGLDGLAGGLSPALLLLAMVAGGISLVAIVVERSEADVTESPLLRRSARAMSLLLPVMAALALWAIWLRVVDRGWSPDRVFVTLIGVIGIAYGLVYAAAVLGGAGWMARIRRGNVYLALGVIGLAALWLTPILNAERISAQSQMARFAAGTTPVEALDVYALRSWGKPGAAAVAVLEAKAKEPGQEALARLLAGDGPVSGADRARLVADLVAVMPVQPPTATGTRDTLLAAAEDYQLTDWIAVCKSGITPGGSGCLMVVADLLPTEPGEEAVLFLQRSVDYVEITGLYLGQDGRIVSRGTVQPNGRYPTGAEATALMRQYQDKAPPVTGALLNQLGTGETGLIVVP